MSSNSANTQLPNQGGSLPPQKGHVSRWGLALGGLAAAAVLAGAAYGLGNCLSKGERLEVYPTQTSTATPYATSTPKPTFTPTYTPTATPEHTFGITYKLFGVLLDSETKREFIDDVRNLSPSTSIYGSMLSNPSFIDEIAGIDLNDETNRSIIYRNNGTTLTLDLTESDLEGLINKYAQNSQTSGISLEGESFKNAMHSDEFVSNLADILTGSKITMKMDGKWIDYQGDAQSLLNSAVVRDNIKTLIVNSSNTNKVTVATHNMEYAFNIENNYQQVRNAIMELYTGGN